jgi:hypothetical protein
MQMTAVALITCLLAASVSSGRAKSFAQRTAKSPAAIPNPHHHAKGEDVLKDVAPEVKIVEASMPQNAELKNLVLNKSLVFSSFTVTTEEGLERIFVVHVPIPNRAEKVYEIQGVAWPNRPVSDPVWVGDYLIFDRSVNPQRSIHYAFDLSKRLIVAARAF